MDIQMKIETRNTFFSSNQGQISRRSEGHEVAIYLRNGSIWVGHFIDDHGELNFGDDRPDVRMAWATFCMPTCSRPSTPALS